MGFDATDGRELPVTTQADPVVSDKTINKFHVTDFTLRRRRTDINDTTLLVKISCGYEEASVYYHVHSADIVVRGAALTSAMTAMCTATNSRWNEIKGAVWPLILPELVARGLCSDGSIV